MRRLCSLLLISLGALFAQSAGEPTDASDWLARGVDLYKHAKYADAVEAFRHARDLDPSSVSAQMDLATAYFVQYVPGSTAAENLALAANARAAYEGALTLQPNNKTALQYLGAIAFQSAATDADVSDKLRRLEEARAWYRKLLAVDPRSTVAYYSLATIDWVLWYPKYSDALKQAGMTENDEHPIPYENIRTALRKSSAQLVDDGIANLQKALDIDFMDDRSAAYMNLFVRESAALDETRDEYAIHTEIAYEWEQRSLNVKSARAAAAAPPSHPGTLRIRVDGKTQALKALTKVPPVYPLLAKQVRIEGTVRYQLILGTDGHVQSLQFISGHPLLVQATETALLQWVYKPTLQNGQPVEVVTTVEVNFTLSQ